MSLCFPPGTVGDWKTHFSPEQNVKVDIWIEKNIEELQLDREMFRALQ